jgi:2-keto-4-pentenoate hydratase
MTGPRQAQLLAAADLLLDARRTTTPIADLPPEVRPATLEEAWYLQSQMILAFGDVGGWKVGAGTPDAEPVCAPMPQAWIAGNAATLAAPHFRFRGLEAEVAFLLGDDLPPREQPYTLDEVRLAIQSCHPAIEVLESGLIDPLTADTLSVTGDLQMHGGFVFGPACPTWREIDFSQERVTLAIDGSIRVERTGSNTAGDLYRLLPWLATEGAARTGGLHAGQWITTGSWTGVKTAETASAVDVNFRTLGRVSFRFA